MRGHTTKAIFNLGQLSTYLRPGSLLRLRKLGLVGPTHGVTRAWSVVTSLSETSDVSKTGTKDDSVLLDSTWTAFLGPVLQILANGPKMDKVWTFDYSQYLSVFHDCCQDLGY